MEKVTGADFKSATADDNKKLFIETYGCQMNVADSEVIASVMQMAGYSVADTLEEADAVFMNTCSIRDNAEQKILNRLEFFHSLKKKKRGLIVGVLGCMAERVKDDLITNHHVDLVVGPDAYLTLPELIASVEAGEKAINVELSTTETYRGCHSLAHLRKPHLRLRVHYARVQQFLYLLHRSLHPWPRAQP